MFSLIIRTGQNEVRATIKEKAGALEKYSGTMSQGNTAYVGVKEDNLFTFNIGNLVLNGLLSTEVKYATTSDFDDTNKS